MGAFVVRYLDAIKFMQLLEGDIVGLILILSFYLILFFILSYIPFLPLWSKIVIVILSIIWLLRKFVLK